MGVSDATSSAMWLMADDLPHVFHVFADIDMSFLYFCMCLKSCLAIRQSDGPQRDNKLFAVTKPFASCVGSMLVCMGGSIFLSIFLGIPMLSFKSDITPVTALLCWYLANHSPFDIFWKLWGNAHFQLAMFILVESRRMRNIMTAISLTREVYPDSIIAWVIGAFLYSCGSVLMKTFEEAIRGKPKTNELKNPGVMTKVALNISLIYCACLLGNIPVEAKAMVIICTNLVLPLAANRYISGNDIDPFQPLEASINAVAFSVQETQPTPAAPEKANPTKSSSRRKANKDSMLLDQVPIESLFEGQKTRKRGAK